MLFTFTWTTCFTHICRLLVHDFQVDFEALFHEGKYKVQTVFKSIQMLSKRQKKIMSSLVLLVICTTLTKSSLKK